LGIFIFCGEIKGANNLLENAHLLEWFDPFISLSLYSLSGRFSVDRQAGSGTMKPARLSWVFWIQRQTYTQGTGSNLVHITLHSVGWSKLIQTSAYPILFGKG